MPQRFFTWERAGLNMYNGADQDALHFLHLAPHPPAPTAAGKTALALKLAQAFPVEIVSADAFTVYTGLDIGTAKPTPAEQAQVPHHLLDVMTVQAPFDVAQWLNLAQAAITAILGRRNIPLIVGGSGFYLKALLRGCR